MGLLDSTDEDKAAASVMADLGFDESPQVVEEPTPPQPEFNETYQEDPRQPPQEEPEVDIELSEVERRLAKAQLYKQMISGSLFDSSGEIVEEVEQEFHAFARNQLQLLMGLSVKEETPPLFTEEEVSVLRYLVESVKTRLETQKAKPTTKQSQTVKSQKPAVEQPKPVTKTAAVKQESPKKPQLKTRAVPEEVPTNKKAPTTKPQPKKPTPEIKLPPKLTVPPDGAEIEEGGSKFRIKHVEMLDVDKYGIMDGSKIRKLPDQGTCLLSNGIQVAKQGSTVIEVLRTALTPVVEVPGRVPFPTREQMTSITKSMSQAQVDRFKPPSVKDILRIKE